MKYIYLPPNYLFNIQCLTPMAKKVETIICQSGGYVAKALKMETSYLYFNSFLVTKCLPKLLLLMEKCIYIYFSASKGPGDCNYAEKLRPKIIIE